MSETDAVVVGVTKEVTGAATKVCSAGEATKGVDAVVVGVTKADASGPATNGFESVGVTNVLSEVLTNEVSADGVTKDGVDAAGVTVSMTKGLTFVSAAGVTGSAPKNNGASTGEAIGASGICGTTKAFGEAVASAIGVTKEVSANGLTASVAIGALAAGATKGFTGAASETGATGGIGAITGGTGATMGVATGATTGATTGAVVGISPNTNGASTTGCVPVACMPPKGFGESTGTLAGSSFSPISVVISTSS